MNTGKRNGSTEELVWATSVETGSWAYMGIS